MPDQRSEINSVLRERITLIGKIAQANAEHLRLLQLLSGTEILLMKDPKSPELMQTMSDTEIGITNSQTGIEALEAELAELDTRIEITLNKET